VRDRNGTRAGPGADSPPGDERPEASSTAPPVLPVPASRASAVRQPAVRESAVEPTDALSSYMSQLRHHAPISREAERDLALRWRDDGDVEAARELVLANLRLVVKIAMDYRRSWTQLLDLIQEGNLGLAQAVQRFDPDQGAKLSSYAAYWIRAYILKFLIDNIRLVRMGSSRAERKLFFRLNKEKRELERQGFEVEPKLLAERLDVTEEDVVSMEQRLSEREVSFDAPLGTDDSNASFGDFVASEGPSVEERVADADLRRTFLEHVHAFAEGLSPRDRQIVEQRLLADPPRTLNELGEEFGVTRERVRQLEARVMKKLREYLKHEVVDFEFYGSEE
jgi:RNA polymerase sigma-32 factor